MSTTIAFRTASPRQVVKCFRAARIAAVAKGSQVFVRDRLQVWPAVNGGDDRVPAMLPLDPNQSDRLSLARPTCTASHVLPGRPRSNRLLLRTANV
jgi:hypothetical protein